LLVAADDPAEAERLAQRAVEVDEYAEGAYRVLAAAALARGDRASALRTLARCDAMLGELGVAADTATRQLARRVRAAEPAT
jgi:DNA-binding SARP family transcriptional activator